METSLIRITSAALVLVSSILAYGQAPVASGYAPVDGLKMHYEVHGTGQPLILLHGGLGAGDMFNAILPELCKDREVITVDLQGHGRTADINRPLSYESMAVPRQNSIRYQVSVNSTGFNG